MGNISRQDVQSIVDNARNTLLQRLVTKQELQSTTDTTRDRLITLLQQQAQLIKQMNYQSIQMFRRTVAMEQKMATLEHDLKASHQLMLYMAENMPRQIAMPVMPEQSEQAPQQYVYSST